MEVIKKLGLNESKVSWIFFQDSGKLLEEILKGVSNDNILSESEYYFKNACENSPEDQPAADVHKDLVENILNTDLDWEIESLNDEIESLKKMENECKEFNDDLLSSSERSLRTKLTDLELNLYTVKHLYEQRYLKCLRNQAKTLDDVKMRNFTLYKKAKKGFTETQNSPVFLHQIDPTEYLQKTEWFVQNFELFIRSNFKTECSSLEIEHQQEELDVIENQLARLERNLSKLSFGYLQENRQATALQALSENYNISITHFNSLSDVLRETKEIRRALDVILMVYDPLAAELRKLVDERVEHRIQLVLKVNTSSKLESAKKRLKDLKLVQSLTNDVLDNAEMLWIMNQLDIQKISNNISYHDQWSEEAKNSWRRTKAMRNLRTMPDYVSTTREILFQRITEMLNKSTLGISMLQRAEDNTKTDSFISAYESMVRLNEFYMQILTNKDHYKNLEQILQKICNAELVCKRFIYDGPISMPTISDIQTLHKLFEVNAEFEDNEKSLRHVRSEWFQETKRMENDKFYKALKSLWVWFLTEPERVILALEEVKKAAAQIPALGSLRRIGGIKRQ